MTNSNKTNKLVTSKKTGGETKRTWADQYTKVVVYAKVHSKLSKALAKHNKGLAKEKQISKVKAISDAVTLWLEKSI